MLTVNKSNGLTTFKNALNCTKVFRFDVIRNNNYI